MCFNQRGDISILYGSSLKLVDKFTYLWSNVSSTEKDVNTRHSKGWTAIDRLSVIWKSDLTDKIKRSFSKQRSCRYCYLDALHGYWLNVRRKNFTGNYKRMLGAIINKSWRQHPTKQQMLSVYSSAQVDLLTLPLIYFHVLCSGTWFKLQDIPQHYSLSLK